MPDVSLQLWPIPDFLWSKGSIVLAFLILVLWLERRYPVARMIGGIKRVAKNFGLAGFNLLLAPLIVIPITQWADVHALDWRPEAWNIWWVLIIDLIVLDMWIYWWHRINHVVPFLWRFHEVHHLDETLDASSAVRFHFGEVALSSLVRAAVIVLLDMPLVSIIFFELLVTLSAIFHHSNWRLKPSIEKALSRIIVTPSIHWVHHHALRRDTDSNYSTILSIWDHLFGSGSAKARDPDMPIGVEGRRDQKFIELALRPFK